MSQGYLLIFGDQLVQKLPAVKKLYGNARSHRNLRSFLREATDTVQCLAQTLPKVERESFGIFTDIIQLTQHYESQPNPDEMIGAVIITIVQIGETLL